MPEEKCANPNCEHPKSDHPHGPCTHEIGNRDFGSEGAGYLHQEDICQCIKFVASKEQRKN